MRKAEVLERFKEMFWEAFHVPELKTEKIRNLYNELEQFNTVLAGPLFSIYESGQCDFVFADNERFPSIRNNTDLFERNIAIATHYRDRLVEIETQKTDEIEDLKVLLYQVDLKMELVDLTFRILES